MGRKIVVYHTYYGCETGCCGHAISYADEERGVRPSEIETGSGEQFWFDHPWNEDPLEWAKDIVRDEMGEEHVADLDWERCIILED